MPWIQNIYIQNIYIDAICGSTLGLVKGLFGVSVFTEAEVEEIYSLKQLALSVLEKDPKLQTESIVCESIVRPRNLCKKRPT